MDIIKDSKYLVKLYRLEVKDKNRKQYSYFYTNDSEYKKLLKKDFFFGEVSFIEIAKAIANEINELNLKTDTEERIFFNLNDKDFKPNNGYVDEIIQQRFGFETIFFKHVNKDWIKMSHEDIARDFGLCTKILNSYRYKQLKKAYKYIEDSIYKGLSIDNYYNLINNCPKKLKKFIKMLLDEQILYDEVKVRPRNLSNYLVRRKYKKLFYIESTDNKRSIYYMK